MSDFEFRVCELYRRLYSGLPTGRAILTIGPSRDPAGGVDVALTPTNPRSATISVHIIGDVAYLRLGRASISEVLNDSKHPERPIEAVRQISEAVMRGCFEEEVWESRERIEKAVGSLVIDGKISKLRYRLIGHPFRRTTKITRRYDPYYIE